MISDILSDAVVQIDGYLSETDIYSGSIREEIVAVRNLMDAVRAKLDMPPSFPD